MNQHSSEKILYVTASPRGEASHSIPVADSFLREYGEQRAIAIDRIDAFSDLVPFAGREAEAKMAVIGGERVPAADRTAWEEVAAICQRVLDADLLLFATPMWNGGIPWALKLFVDIVTQPGIAFRFDPERGYSGLLGGRRAVTVYASRVYAPAVPAAFGVDYQSTYLRWWLEYCGIEEIHELRFQPTFPTDDFEERRRQAHAEAGELAMAMAAGGRLALP